MVFQILGVAIALLALGISSLSLYLQRAVPRLEAQLLGDVDGSVGVAVRNTGKAAAKSPWFLLATGEMSANSQFGNGFIGVDEGYIVQTQIPTTLLKKGVSRGVVGCRDHTGKYVTWDFDGGRSKRRKSASFEEAFRSFHKEIPLGVQAGMQSQQKT